MSPILWKAKPKKTIASSKPEAKSKSKVTSDAKSSSSKAASKSAASSSLSGSSKQDVNAVSKQDFSGASTQDSSGVSKQDANTVSKQDVKTVWKQDVKTVSKQDVNTVSKNGLSGASKQGMNGSSKQDLNAVPKQDSSRVSQQAIVPKTNVWDLALKSLNLKDQDIISNLDKLNALTHLKSAAEEKKELCVRNRWRIGGVVFWEVLGKILNWVEKFIQIGDVVAQYDPIHTAIPWACIRVILQVKREIQSNPAPGESKLTNVGCGENESNFWSRAARP
jgi:hypothetical protein